MIRIPAKLQPGDGIAIVSPATIVKEEYVAGAARFLADAGYRPIVMPHANGPAKGSYAASAPDRVADLSAAFRDPEIRAILCARGGYGSVELLPSLPAADIRRDPKWVIGFSDISALHAYMLSLGIGSLHAPMAKHLTVEEPDHYATTAMMRILSEGPESEFYAPPHLLDIPGSGEGVLVGGNLAVLNGLAATPYDIFNFGKEEETPLIIFIEDISEAIYAVERMLRRLALSGTFRRVRGLIVGAFTDYRHPDRNFPDMETMISALLDEYGLKGQFPVCFGFPVGHTSDNVPLVEGASARLQVSPGEGSVLTIAG